MPTYTYECQKCHKVVEIQQSVSARVPPMCFEDGCNGEPMESVITQSSFILKGSGWAKDGYG